MVRENKAKESPPSKIEDENEQKKVKTLCEDFIQNNVKYYFLTWF